MPPRFERVATLASLAEHPPLLAVATFNVKQFADELDVAQRMGPLVELIRNLVDRHDVVCLQEVTKPLYLMLLKMGAAVTDVPQNLQPQFDGESPSYGICVTILNRRRGLMEAAIPHQIVSVVQLDRKVVVVDILVRSGSGQNQRGGDTLRVANVHLRADQPDEERDAAYKAREDQLLAIAAEKASLPDIIAGDFNYDEGEPFPLARMMTDCSANSGPTWQEARLDRVYIATGLMLGAGQVAVRTLAGSSDHKAVSMTVEAPRVVQAPQPFSNVPFDVAVAAGSLELTITKLVDKKLDLDLACSSGIELNTERVVFKARDQVKTVVAKVKSSQSGDPIAERWVSVTDGNIERRVVL
jgi:endonuclease/exonuclease/phosphatase family metal-dependent hydrolase